MKQVGQKVNVESSAVGPQGLVTIHVNILSMYKQSVSSAVRPQDLVTIHVNILSMYKQSMFIH